MTNALRRLQALRANEEPGDEQATAEPRRKLRLSGGMAKAAKGVSSRPVDALRQQPARAVPAAPAGVEGQQGAVRAFRRATGEERSCGSDGTSDAQRGANQTARLFAQVRLSAGLEGNLMQTVMRVFFKTDSRYYGSRDTLSTHLRE
jgi:hypothetical protein